LKSFPAAFGHHKFQCAAMGDAGDVIAISGGIHIPFTNPGSMSSCKF
jgi:hypothetical protein